MSFIEKLIDKIIDALNFMETKNEENSKIEAKSEAEEEGEDDDDEENVIQLTLGNSPGLNILYNLPAICDYIGETKFMKNIWPVVTNLKAECAIK
jgi:hypothetical protein